MTDLVLLYGVRWLLHSEVFGFSEYTVEFGHESKNQFDITAEQNGQRLVGEAFNVAPSFFQGKKAAMLKKLRSKANGATYTVIMCNADAVHGEYVPAKDKREHHVFVDVGAGTARMIPGGAAVRAPGDT